MSKAQQNQNYIAKLKATSKYDDHKKKKAEKARAYRLKKQEAEDEMPLLAKSDVISQRREATRESVRKCREKKRAEKENAQVETESITSRESSSFSLDDLASVAYTCPQTLGKAKRKVVRALPSSPTKKKAILAQIVSEMNDAEKTEITNAVSTTPPKTRVKAARDLTILKKAIKEFYERDDVSRMSPKTRDVKEYVCPDTGNKILLPTRHMQYTIKEAFALFDEEQQKTENGI